MGGAPSVAALDAALGFYKTEEHCGIVQKAGGDASNNAFIAEWIWGGDDQRTPIWIKDFKQGGTLKEGDLTIHEMITDRNGFQIVIQGDEVSGVRIKVDEKEGYVNYEKKGEELQSAAIKDKLSLQEKKLNEQDEETKRTNRVCQICYTNKDGSMAYATGTCCFLDNKTFILTNFHVISTAAELVDCVIFGFTDNKKNRGFDVAIDVQEPKLFYANKEFDFCAFEVRPALIKEKMIVPYDLTKIVEASEGQDIYLYGHPAGLVMEKRDGEVVNCHENFINHSIKTQVGSSGSLIYSGKKATALHCSALTGNDGKVVGKANKITKIVPILKEEIEKLSSKKVNHEDIKIVVLSELNGSEITKTYPNGIYVGGFKFNKRSGHGVFTWSDGNKYDGQWKDDVAHGKGVSINIDGGRYEGDFVNWKKSGNGILIWPKGDKYVGEWRDDSISGKGTLLGIDHSKYEGEWNNWKKCGHGKFTWADGSTFEGDWLNDMPNGKGVYLGSNNTSKYEGQWKDWKKFGHGKFTWADGSTFEGDWQNDAPNGKGVNIGSDNSKYEGEWKDWKKHGKGIFTWSDGTRYDGFWVDNLAEGHGVTTFSNGGSYNGEWKAGKRNGRGIITWADGNKWDGIWKDDAQVIVKLLSSQTFSTQNLYPPLPKAKYIDDLQAPTKITISLKEISMSNFLKLIVGAAVILSSEADTVKNGLYQATVPSSAGNACADACVSVNGNDVKIVIDFNTVPVSGVSLTCACIDEFQYDYVGNVISGATASVSSQSPASSNCKCTASPNGPSGFTFANTATGTNVMSGTTVAQTWTSTKSCTLCSGYTATGDLSAFATQNGGSSLSPIGLVTFVATLASLIFLM